MGYLDEINRKWAGAGNEKELYPDIGQQVELRLELSNICNHACIFCPNRLMKRKKREMEEGLVYRLLEEGRENGIIKCGLFMNGEPFVTSKLAEYIRYAKKIGYEYIYITTNGALATPLRLKEVIDAGVDSIKFSINAGSRQTYQKVHQKDDYDKVIEHLQYAYEYRKKTGRKLRLLSSFVATKYTIDEIDEHYARIKPFVDELVFVNATCFAGQMNEEIEKVRATVEHARFPKFILKNEAPCKSLWNSINVTCEGYLTLCCSESYNYLVVEDVNNQSLKAAWQSERMADMRKRHITDKLEGTCCYRCLNEEQKNWGEIVPLNEELYKKSREEK